MSVNRMAAVTNKPPKTGSASDKPPGSIKSAASSTSRKSKTSARLFSQEQQFIEMNAELEERTANFMNEADSVLACQDKLFSDLTISERASISPMENKPAQKENMSRMKKTKTSKSTKSRSSRLAPGVKPLSVTSLIEDRTAFVNRIEMLEMQAADDTFLTSEFEDQDSEFMKSDVGPDATIRFMQAKLRVMQDELENMDGQCREKSSLIAKLKSTIKGKEDAEKMATKKQASMQSIIEKYKRLQDELSTKIYQLESDLSANKKELEEMKRERKNASAVKNTMEVRLNRALEEIEKQKQALKKAKESSKTTNENDRKQFEILKNEKTKLERQKSELMTAFKKQLKLIDVLKRQKMHIEAAKLLEFTEEEFIRALEWKA